MYKIPLSEIKEKLVASGKLTAAELNARISKKINDLSGLISEEGAAHIIANELGVEIMTSQQNKLKIKQVYAGMRSVSTIGKVIRKFEAREFTTNERSGKVCSLILGDETGTIKVVFWNDQVDLLSAVNEGDIIRVKEAYVRENNGNKEIHLGNAGEIEVNPAGETVNSVRESNTYERKKINELSDGDFGAEILGTVVQVFDPRFFNICPQCGKKVLESADGFICGEHGKVEASLSYVMNAVLDDGSGNIRGVFWKNQTNHLLEKNEEEISSYKEDLTKFEDLKNELLGEQFKLAGKVKRNDMFDRLEFNVQTVVKANPEEEIARLEK